MDNFNLTQALIRYNLTNPGSWTIGETYDSLVWHGEEHLKPTEDTLEYHYAQYLIEKEANRYQELRKVAYPSIEDQLDIIYHDGLEAWKGVITAIKEEYPKPEGIE